MTLTVQRSARADKIEHWQATSVDSHVQKSVKQFSYASSISTLIRFFCNNYQNINKCNKSFGNSTK